MCVCLSVRVQLLLSSPTRALDVVRSSRAGGLSNWSPPLREFRTIRQEKQPVIVPGRRRIRGQTRGRAPKSPKPFHTHPTCLMRVCVCVRVLACSPSGNRLPLSLWAEAHQCGARGAAATTGVPPRLGCSPSGAALSVCASLARFQRRTEALLERSAAAAIRG